MYRLTLFFVTATIYSVQDIYKYLSSITQYIFSGVGNLSHWMGGYRYIIPFVAHGGSAQFLVNYMVEDKIGKKRREAENNV